MTRPGNRGGGGGAQTSPEQALIHKAFAPLSVAESGAAGLLDDAASISVPAGMDLVVTKDLIVAGVHFMTDDPPDQVARKALRVNLSDLAAKGIIIVNGRPADGSYVGPGGASFLVKEGIIIVETKPAPSRGVSEKGIIIENAPAPS